MKKIVAIASIASFVFPAMLFAGRVDLTTYYPAPYGEYSQLRSNKATLGTNATIPATEGVMNFGGIAVEPAITGVAATNPNDGDLYYNTTTAGSHKFRYFDGSDGSGKWKDLGGGGALADYDSGWFLVSIGSTYNMNHGLSCKPQRVVVLQGRDATGIIPSVPFAPQQPVLVTDQPGIWTASHTYGPFWRVTNTQVQVWSGQREGGPPWHGSVLADGVFNAAAGTDYEPHGYYRILAWKHQNPGDSDIA